MQVVVTWVGQSKFVVEDLEAYPSTCCHECSKLAISDHFPVEEELRRIFRCREKTINSIDRHRLPSKGIPYSLTVAHDNGPDQCAFHKEGQGCTISYHLQLLGSRLPIEMHVKQVVTHCCRKSCYEQCHYKSWCCPIYVPLDQFARSPVDERLGIRIYGLSMVERVQGMR